MFVFKAWKGRKWESNTRNVSQCYQVLILKNCKGAGVFIREGCFLHWYSSIFVVGKLY